MACLAPNILADGTEVACRECKQCQLTARNAWVGRNIAESKTSKFCYWITGTYGRGKVGESLHERAVILTYSDCQKLLKLLRRHGYDVRFFITGEYGSERGRAHWNIILYSQAPLPAFAGWDQFGRWRDKVPYETRFNWVRTHEDGKPVYLQNGQPAYWWPHGFVRVDLLNYKNIKYVCKYVLKDFDGNGRQGHKGQSKDPPIGTAWFKQLAEKYVDQGLAPQTPEYRHPECRTTKGEVIRFWMKGRVLEIFLQHYSDTWAARLPDRARPASEFVDLFERYGKVVNDEAAMLLRQEFPRGESREDIPTREVVRRYLDLAPFEKALAQFQEQADANTQAYQAQLDRIEDGEKQQRRRQELDRLHLGKWEDFLAEWGREWRFGEGIVIIDPDRAKSGPPIERQPEQVGQPGAELEPRKLQPDYGLGRIGRINRDYGKRSDG